MKQTTSQIERTKSSKRKMTMPKFDMNLKDLFSQEEMANRPLINPLKIQSVDQQTMQSSTSSFDVSSLPKSHQSTSYAAENPQASPPLSFMSHSPQSNLSFSLLNQQRNAPLNEPISQSQPNFSFDDMSFFDTFPISDLDTGSWDGWNSGVNELGLGFGTGGTGGYDLNGSWDPNGIDMFDGFYFGGDGGAGGF